MLFTFSARRRAVTEESTPPDIATTTSNFVINPDLVAMLMKVYLCRLSLVVVTLESAIANAESLVQASLSIATVQVIRVGVVAGRPRRWRVCPEFTVSGHRPYAVHCHESRKKHFRYRAKAK